jgi:hypothetical protein
MRFIKTLFFILFNTFLLLCLVNIIIFFFNSNILNQKYVKENYISNLPISYRVYYSNTNDRSFTNYIAIMGDSQVAGAGSSDPLLNTKNITYFLKKLNPYENYITFSWPGGGSISILKLFELSRDNLIFRRINEDPKKIIYIFNESNDLTDDYNDKYLNITSHAFTKKEYIKQLFPLFYFTYLTFYSYNREFKYSQKITNKIFFQKKKIDISNKGRTEIPEIYGDELEKTYKILFDNLYKIKKRTKELNFIFLPSVATLYKFEEPIKSISYSNGLVINIAQEDYIKYHINLKKNLKVLCEKLNIKFIDLTNEMKIESKQKLLIGPEDFGHYNIEGNQFIAKIINSKLN